MKPKHSIRKTYHLLTCFAKLFQNVLKCFKFKFNEFLQSVKLGANCKQHFYKNKFKSQNIDLL